jgi:hypothetical protein
MPVNQGLTRLFKADQKRYGTKVALHNFATVLATTLLSYVGVKGLELKHSKKAAPKQKAESKKPKQ